MPEHWTVALQQLTPDRERAPIALLVQRLPDERRATPPEVAFDPELGVVGDRWSRKAKRDLEEQVTLMRWDVASLLSQEPATFGDNLFASIDTSAANLPAGTILRVGSARCVVTAKPHTGCSKFARRSSKEAWAFFRDQAPAQLRGVHLRILDGGVAHVGDEIVVISRP